MTSVSRVSHKPASDGLVLGAGTQELAELARLDPSRPGHLERMRALTEALVAQRPRPGRAHAEFVAVVHRGIPDFGATPLRLPERVVVTGGTGCVGQALLRVLASRGVERIVSVSRHRPTADQWVRGVSYVTADVRDHEAIRALMAAERPSVVFHLAAQRQPALAEQQVAETISTNVFGTWSVLAAAGATGVPQTVTASTGKALRYFSGETYAATKKVAEFLVEQAPVIWGTAAGTARFTHVVDNSVVYNRLIRWAEQGLPLRLHSADIAFFAQSAREAAELLVMASQPGAAATPVVALADIGWPHELLPIALDLVDDFGCRSPIEISGFERGYEEVIYPGTVDPVSQLCSPLFNALEVRRRRRCNMEDAHVQTVGSTSPTKSRVEQALVDLYSCLEEQASPDSLRDALRAVSEEILRRTFLSAPTEDLETVRALAERGELIGADHHLVHRHLTEVLEERNGTSAAYRSVG